VIKIVKALREAGKIPTDDPKDRPARIFNIIRILGQKRYFKYRDKFIKTKEGQAILKHNTPLYEYTKNPELLKGYPKDSLGYHLYLVLSNSKFVDLAKFLNFENEEDKTTLEARYAERERDLHDIYHLVFDYTTSRVGEMAVLWTQYWQGNALGFGFVIMLNSFKFIITHPWEVSKHVVRALWDIYLRQRKIKFNYYPFEDNLHKSIQEIQEELKIGPMPKSVITCEKHTKRISGF
jgi:ubiquinone biosynthesis protein Coq4